MRENKTLRVVLTIVGAGALAAYMIACRPSWSPDGTKVLFPYLNSKTNKVGIAMYDRSSGKTESVFARAASVEGEGAPGNWPWAQWDRAGTRAIVVWAEGENEPQDLQIRILPVDSDDKAQQFLVRDVHPTWGVPLCQVGQRLFVGGRALARVDLETGEVERRELEGEEEVVLVGHRNEIYYCCRRPGSPPLYEFGKLDPKRLELKSKLELREDEAGAVFPLMAVAQDGTAIAVPSKKRDRFDLLLIAGDRLKKTVPFELDLVRLRVGNLQWSPDGKTIYAAVISDAKDGDRIQLGLGEVTIATGDVRFVPLVQIRSDTERGMLPLCFQIALSPDGNTIATAPTYLVNELIDERDFALHLVDLTSPQRKVTRIPALPVP